jgi:hypothetical protein
MKARGCAPAPPQDRAPRRPGVDARRRRDLCLGDDVLRRLRRAGGLAATGLSHRHMEPTGRAFIPSRIGLALSVVLFGVHGSRNHRRDGGSSRTVMAGNPRRLAGTLHKRRRLAHWRTDSSRHACRGGGNAIRQRHRRSGPYAASGLHAGRAARPGAKLHSCAVAAVLLPEHRRRGIVVARLHPAPPGAGLRTQCGASCTVPSMSASASACCSSCGQSCSRFPGRFSARAIHLSAF